MIRNNRVALISDLHLGIYGNSEEWHEIAINWAKWFAEDISNSGIKDIFFLGDFFHNRHEISVQTVHVASKIMEIFSKFNIIMIVGNHDAYYKNRSDIHSIGLLKGSSNVTVVDSPLILDSFGAKMAFVPWNCELPHGVFDYIFGHFEIQTFKMNNFKVCNHGLNVSDFLESRTKRVFSGHFHTKSHKIYKEGEIRYIGNPFQQDFNDCGDVKGYYILDLEDGDLKFVENKISPVFKRIKFEEIGDLKENDVSGNIIKLIIDVEVEDEDLVKNESLIRKYKPFKLEREFAVIKKKIQSDETIESINFGQILSEFVEGLNMEADEMNLVKDIIEKLYNNSK